MIEDIKLNEFPKQAGVYKIIWFGNVIYVGSSNNLYQRMKKHRHLIKGGYASCYKNGKKGFYLFLQNNPFTIEFELTEAYREKEQELIKYFEPIYNEIRAFTGCGSKKGREVEYREEYKQKFKKEIKQYHNQKCNYKGEILTLCALVMRFQRQGIKHPTQEARKYLIA